MVARCLLYAVVALQMAFASDVSGYKEKPEKVKTPKQEVTTTTTTTTTSTPPTTTSTTIPKQEVRDTAATTTPPNFVFIVADDLGWNDVGYHSATNAYTPVLDALKAEALELNRFYVYSKCAPTRSSLYTGSLSHHIQMQHDVGLTEQFACSIEHPPELPFWTHKLKSCQNYQHHLIGKWHCGMFRWEDTPMFRGWDSFLGFYDASMDYFNFTYNDIRDFTKDYRLADPFAYGDYATDIWADQALEIIQHAAANPDAAPFTITLAFNAPHSPIHSRQPYRAQAVENEIFAEQDKRRIDYVSMIRAMDDRINDIVTALKTETINGEPIWQNTWLWFFSDNGPVIRYGSAYPLRGAKATLFEGGVRAPAFVTGGLLPAELAGTRTDLLTHVSDIAKTICTQSGSDCSDLALDGEDLTDLLENRESSSSALSGRHVVLNVDSFDCGAQYNRQRVCGGIIKDYGEDVGIFKAVIGNQINGNMTKYGWTELRAQQEQDEPTVHCGGGPPPVFDAEFLANDCAYNNRVCLFNLTADSCEYQDLSEDDAYSEILEELMGLLQEEWDTQSDPFFAVCEQTTQNEETAMEKGGYVPWAEDYYNDDRYSLENTELYQDECGAAATENDEDDYQDQGQDQDEDEVGGESAKISDQLKIYDDEDLTALEQMERYPQES